MANETNELEDYCLIALCVLALLAAVLGAIIYATHPTSVMNGDIAFKTYNDNETNIYPTAEITETMGVSTQIPTPEYEVLVPGDFYQNQHTDCSYYEGEPFGEC